MTIDQDVPPPTLVPFTKFFQGFEKVKAVRKVFGEKTDAVLRRQKVEFVSSKFAYMGVNNDDGHILVGTYHLRNSQFKILYLDVVHELYHIGQYLEGKDHSSPRVTSTWTARSRCLPTCTPWRRPGGSG